MMARLSTDLPGPRELGTCQACGRRVTFTPPSVKRQPDYLTLWQEHDEQDKPEALVVCLCAACAVKLIGPHPRLYRQLSEHEPFPGAMACCIGCRFAQAMSCSNPDSAGKGGDGLGLLYPPPARMHINRGGGRGGWTTVYIGAVQCGGRQDGLTNPQNTERRQS
jgi:hypothetical protein